jgi:hypothetical protein
MIRIANATLEDLAYIASWLSPVDRMELACTRDPDDYMQLANDAAQTMIHKVALDHGGTPIFAFGAHPLGVDAATVWGYKTQAGSRAIKAVTRYLRDEMIPNLRNIGVVRATCYVHQDNHGSRLWLSRLGFRPRATPGDIGAPLVLYQRDEPDVPSIPIH